VTLKPGLGSL